jgi:N-acetylglucosamine kinase-like BadF-type ATPase
MGSYYLGVDIGATKSHALIADETGQVLGFGFAGPGNHEVVGYDGLKSVLKQIVAQALEMAGITTSQIMGAGFGVAGYDWPGELAQTLEAISCLELQSPVEVVNDTIIGLVAGAEQGWGVGLVSGTGCNCWGWDENHKIGHVTGMGGWFGEYAGGGDLVQRAIVSVAHEYYGRGPATQLTPAILKLTGAIDPLDLFEGLTLEKYHIDSRAAPLVFQIAKSGDRVATSVLEWAGQELGELANSVIRQIKLQDRTFALVMIGSVFSGGSMIIEPLQKSVHAIAPGANFIRLKAPPVTGGVLIGMQLAGLKISHIRSRLFETSRSFLPE